MLSYSELLKSYIEKSGKTLQEIAINLQDYDFRISKGYISQLQNGKTDRPATDELTRALAAVTGGNVEDLLTASLIEKAPIEIKEKIIRLQQLKEVKQKYEQLKNSGDNFTTVKEAATEYTTSEYKKIPVLGQIAAGQPIDRIEYFEDIEYVDRSILRGQDAFGLRVKGDSMIGDHIADGDIVICIAQSTVTSNDIAVVAVDDELATLKRVKIQDDMCMLIPSNSKLQPILIASEKIHILGKVIEVRRRF